MKFGKKLLSMILAGAMTLAVGASAMAADQTDITGGFVPITLDVTVPTTGTAQINPYGLPVSIGTSGTTTYKLTGRQIVTQPLGIVNNGDVALDVGATAVGEVTGKTQEMRLASEAPAADDTLKNAFVYVQATETAGRYTGAAYAASDEFLQEYSGWAASDYSADDDILVATIASEKKTLGTIGAAVDDTGAALHTSNGLMIRLAGSCTKEPRQAWASTDTFKVTIAYTFTPNIP